MTARPLEALLVELASAFSGTGGGVAPTSVEFDLPVETRVEADEGGLVVRADLPPTRLRTAFDRPVGRLVVTLARVSGPDGAGEGV